VVILPLVRQPDRLSFRRDSTDPFAMYLLALLAFLVLNQASALNKSQHCECRLGSNNRIRQGFPLNETTTIPWLVSLMVISSDVERLTQQKEIRWQRALNAPLDPSDFYSESIEQRKYYTGIGSYYIDHSSSKSIR
jgi:hypothetical protein